MATDTNPVKDRRNNLPTRSKGSEKLPMGPRQKFLSVMYRCCNVYGRMYANKANTQYDGKCPKCGNSVSAVIGSEGTNKRLFEAN